MTMPTMPGKREWTLGTAGALAIAAGAVAWRRGTAARSRGTRGYGMPVSAHRAAIVEAAQRLNRGAGLIATSTLLDSAVEHYRGSFHNKVMFTPLIASALALAVSVHGTGDKRKIAHRVRDPIYAGAALTGLLGTGFHIYNIAKRPGGFSWQNLFYGSPLGAPAAVALSGLLGYYSERLRDSHSMRPRVFGFRAGRAIAALTSIGMLATAAEAALLHFRGAYHDPFMFVPVTVPPVAAVLLAETAVSHPRRPRRFTAWWLRLTALVGCLGSAFHAWGVSRNMGGWRNWRQNVLNGPPIPAPPSFTGLALAGLAALDLLRKHPNA
jgi:hypothetical protein